MEDDNLITVAQLKEFAKLTNSAKFKSKDKKETYEWVDKTLGKFRYRTETKKNRDRSQNCVWLF